MLAVEVQDDKIYVGEHFVVDFQRTLRLPDDGQVYPLPPGLGSFPVCRVEDYAHRIPDQWKKLGGFFIPMYQREALWLNFGGSPAYPQAVKIATGKINALSGKPWSKGFQTEQKDRHTERQRSTEPQDYIIVPDQPWLDGFRSGDGSVCQFAVPPVEKNETFAQRYTGNRTVSLHFTVYAPHPGTIDPCAALSRGMQLMRSTRDIFQSSVMLQGHSQRGELEGIAQKGPADSVHGTAGEKVRQVIYPDPYGAKTWDENNSGEFHVHLADTGLFRKITGLEPPSIPISAATYSEYGLPWYDFYAEEKGPRTGVSGPAK